MRKGIKKYIFLNLLLASSLFVLILINQNVTGQIDSQELDVSKENPIPIYLASNVFSVDNLLIVDTFSELQFFNNTNKEDPQYLWEYKLLYYMNDYINVDDLLYSTGRIRNDSTTQNYYFVVHSINQNASLELIREYYLPYGYSDFIILKNDSSMVLTINSDRQSLSLFNCTGNLVELPIEYTHESFFVNDVKITGSFYEEGYLILETRDYDLDNKTVAIFDMSNYTQPKLLLSWHSIIATPNFYNGLSVEGNRLYLTTNYGYAKVLNITDDKTLEDLGFFNTGHSHGFMKIVEYYAFISTGNSINIFNLADWENISQMGSYNRTENQGTFDVFFVIDDLIYLSHYTSRTDNLLILLDWSDPSNPFFIRTFGYPYTENINAFILAVPIVFLVFTVGFSKRKREENKKIIER